MNVDDAEQRAQTRDAYDRLAPVWSATTDDGPFNGGLERPALQRLLPRPLSGSTVLDAGCGSGGQCAWLLDQGADVIGVDLSPRMIEAAADRCSGRGQFIVADLAESLPVPASSCDGITSSLALHYLRDWSAALESFATVLRPGGWVVLSLDHPFGAPLAGQPGGYFDVELVTDRWRKADVEVTQRFWRRPLADPVNAFGNAGFAVDRVIETRPDAQAVHRWPDELGSLVDRPSFIVYRLRLL